MDRHPNSYSSKLTFLVENYRVGSGTKVNEITQELEGESGFGQGVLGGIDGTNMEHLLGA